ncbi:MAG TPA: type II secretion system protein [Syntrophales bacterium]|nr:type II secretion system protein [Syntrophales bacterium]HOX94025.1 type II secretion system protein [Syntrophales bacterium]HPI58307.1 type II secretion system protein [Syntrophales bacterium]HPN26125.1 type II secretion system protein [Syntrophales bacterium]HQM30502.1 type II secretion system protein [Syntrophales bacterium]
MSKEQMNILRAASGRELHNADTTRANGKSSPGKDRRGFTLIEMIAVIAIIGILTAMALPKYFSTMNLAKQKIAQAVVAEGHERVNTWGVGQYLQNGLWPTTDQYEGAADSIGSDAGDFSIAYKKVSESTLKISVEGKKTTSFEGVEASILIAPPGNGAE